MRIGIVGGGMLGLATAHYLVGHGAEVAVFDRGVVGLAGASKGNAGWISPALSSLPLPAPGVMNDALRWAAEPGSPLLMRPSLSPAVIRWCTRFALACRPAAFRHGRNGLMALTERAIESYEDLRDSGISFEMGDRDLLIVALKSETLHHEAALFGDLEATGFPVRSTYLSAEQARAMEPGLSSAVVGGLVVQGDRHVRPETVTAGLADTLRAAHAAVHEQTTVHSLEPLGGGRWRLRYADTEEVFDSVVVAAGAATTGILAPLGYRVPLIGAKGYSITGPRWPSAPNRPIYLAEAKVAYTPFTAEARLAGTLELPGRDTSLRSARLQPLTKAGDDYFAEFTLKGESWAGLRPSTPDGLPLIGALSHHENLFINGGHGMCGIVLGPISGRLLADRILSGRTEPALSGSSPQRFGL